MVCHLFGGADRIGLCFITGFAMRMGILFCFRADQNGSITLLSMIMFLTAGGFRCGFIAFRTMGMRRLLGLLTNQNGFVFIALISVQMLLKLRQSANQLLPLIIAATVMGMQHPLAEAAGRISKGSFAIRSVNMRCRCALRNADLGTVTGLCVFMSLLTADRILRQSNSRQHQRINRAEYHDQCQCTDCTLPHRAEPTKLAALIQLA